jgi:hypothetical protein
MYARAGNVGSKMIYGAKKAAVKNDTTVGPFVAAGPTNPR